MRPVYFTTGRPDKVGAAITHARIAANLTQKEVAQMVGCHQAHVSNIERGEGITSPTARKIIDLLQVTMPQSENASQANAKGQVEEALLAPTTPKVVMTLDRAREIAGDWFGSPKDALKRFADTGKMTLEALEEIDAIIQRFDDSPAPTAQQEKNRRRLRHLRAFIAKHVHDEASDRHPVEPPMVTPPLTPESIDIRGREISFTAGQDRVDQSTGHLISAKRERPSRTVGEMRSVHPSIQSRRDADALAHALVSSLREMKVAMPESLSLDGPLARQVADVVDSLARYDQLMESLNTSSNDSSRWARWSPTEKKWIND